MEKGEYNRTHSTINSYFFGNINFALGDGIVGTYTKYKFTWCVRNNLKQGILSWSGYIHVHYLDIFKHPFKTAGIGITSESGVPYAYEYKKGSHIGVNDITVI